MPTKAEIQRDLNEKNVLINQLNRQLDDQRIELENLRQRFERMDRAADVQQRAELEQQHAQQQQNQPPQQQHPPLQHFHNPQPPLQHIQQVQQEPQHLQHLPQQFLQQPYVNQFGRHARLCRSFSGKERVVTPEAWVNFFELRTRNFTDQQRIDTLADYLDEGAQDWYMRQRTADNVGWQQLKHNFITFFSASVRSPGVTAAHMKFKPDDDLQKYFQEKCRHFDLANLQLTDRIDFLTDGILEDSIREGMLIATINSLDEWYQKARTLVSNYERKRESKNRFSQRSHPNSTPHSNGTAIKSSFKPANNARQPPDCKICKTRNIVARHWHSDCPHRGVPSTSASATTPRCRHVAAGEEPEEIEQADSAPLNE